MKFLFTYSSEKSTVCVALSLSALAELLAIIAFDFKNNNNNAAARYKTTEIISAYSS